MKDLNSSGIYLINPNSTRKLEWMKNITFSEAKMIILKAYKEFNEKI